ASGGETMTHHAFVRAAAAVAGCGALAACAPTGGPDGAGDRTARQCFRPEQVTGFSAVDDRTVYVTTSPRRIFRLELLGPCPDVDWSHRIGIRSRRGSWGCRGLDEEILIPAGIGNIGPRRCPVTHVAQLTDEEVEAFRTRRARSGPEASETPSAE